MLGTNDLTSLVPCALALRLDEDAAFWLWTERSDVTRAREELRGHRTEEREKSPRSSERCPMRRKNVCSDY